MEKKDFVCEIVQKNVKYTKFLCNSENIKNENDFIFISVKDTSTIIYIREIISDTEFCPITISHDRFSNFNSYMCVLFIIIDNFYEYGL